MYIRSEEEIINSWNIEYDNPLVSISCLTYNHEKYIGSAIESFLMQETTFPIEILIHDDASTDNTSNIIKNYEKVYPNIIKVKYQKENQYSKGVRRLNFKYNFNRANGKYIALNEGDDFWKDPYKLQKQVAKMEENTDYSMICHASYKIKGKQFVGSQKPYDYETVLTPDIFLMNGGGIIATNSILFRTRLLGNLPNYVLNAPTGDIAIFNWLSYVGEVRYIPELMSVYRIEVEGSWSKRYEENKIKMIEHNYRTINSLDDYNKYTNFEYDNIINNRIEQLKFNITMLKRDDKVFNMHVYNSLNRREKLKIILLMKVPIIYDFMLKSKKYINHKCYDASIKQEKDKNWYIEFVKRIH